MCKNKKTPLFGVVYAIYYYGIPAQLKEDVGSLRTLHVIYQMELLDMCGVVLGGGSNLLTIVG